MTQSYPYLSEEAAQGKGEHLEILAQLMGCPQEEQALFQSLTQQHYAELFQLQKIEAKPFLGSLRTVLANQVALSCTG